MNSVILEFSVDGLPALNGDNAFHADTDMAKEVFMKLQERGLDPKYPVSTGVPR